MKIEVVSLQDITPYYNNPRDNAGAVAPVIESIKRFGFVKPIICDKQGVIIAGHTRYMAAFQMGCPNVPVIYSDMSEEQAKQFRIADNKLAEKSMFDEDKLIVELKNLSVPEDMQAFFFEDLNDMLGFSFNDFQSQLDDPYEEDFTDDDTIALDDGENSSEESVETGQKLNYEDLYRVRVVDGIKVMTVVCPYCGNVETIEV